MENSLKHLILFDRMKKGMRQVIQRRRRFNDIENSIIGIKEPIYPDNVNGDYSTGIGQNWVRPEINNTTTYISYAMYTNNYELGGFLDPSSNWSRYKGPFDIVPVPLPTTDNSVATLQEEITPPPKVVRASRKPMIQIGEK